MIGLSKMELKQQIEREVRPILTRLPFDSDLKKVAEGIINGTANAIEANNNAIQRYLDGLTRR